MKAKTRYWILGSGGAAVVAIVVTAGYLVLAPGPASRAVGQTGPAPTAATADSVAADYLAAFASRSPENAANYTDDSPNASASLTKVYQGMGDSQVTAKLTGPPTANGSSATANYAVSWHLPGGGDFSYQDSMEVRHAGDKWQVHWAETIVHPALGRQQALALKVVPGKSTVLDRTGKPIANATGIIAQAQQEAGGATGTDGWRVVAVDAAGAESKTLGEQKGTTAGTYTVTIDPKIQQAAQAALDGYQGPGTIVALQPSTGELLAVAQNAAFQSSGGNPLIGRYPPGSTFKIVTATAALEQGKVNSGSMLPCPGKTLIGGTKIPNENEFTLGAAPNYLVPMHSTFAASCNTTFSQLAADMDADSLPNAARQLGIGVDFTIPGITTNTGKIESASDLATRAADGYGQGTDLVSPFGMAVVAATVQSGKIPTPVLIRGKESTVDGKVAAPPNSVLTQLRGMMREVCTSGTAKQLANIPGVAGKTGTAEYDSTHAHGWFVGYSGDLAFAVLLPGAGDSTPAVNVAGTFLRAI